MHAAGHISWKSNVALTGHVFELVHCGEDRRLTVLQVEDDEQWQSIIVEQGTGTTGITYTLQQQQQQQTGCMFDRMKS